MRNNALNFLFFVAVAVGFYFLWTYAEKNWLPNPAAERAKREAEEKKQKEEGEAKRTAEETAAERAREEKVLAAVAAGGSISVGAAEAKVRAEAGAAAAAQRKAAARAGEERVLAAAAAGGFAATAVPPAPPRPTLVPLGDETFFVQTLLSTRGGGVQQVILRKFEAADRLGRPVLGTPLYLVPGVPQTRDRSLTQVREEGYIAPVLAPGVQPVDVPLAEPSFAVFHYPDPDANHPDPRLGEVNWAVVSEDRPAGGSHTVVFEADLGDPYFVRFRKTYTLAPKDYHVGLKVEITRRAGGKKGSGLLRYQIAGAHGLPLEGEWYTTTPRTALIGWQDRKGASRRQAEDAASVAAKRGGEVVTRGDNTFKYMVTATPFFASGVAIDDTAEGAAKNPWAYVRATTELPFRKEADRRVPYFDDLTVRAASEVLDLDPGQAVVHSYVLYNGPAKVGLLGLMRGDMAVAESLVERYRDGLDLKTITDFRSDNWFGRFASAIFWSDLVIAVTNFMHWLLATIHLVVPSWALCIVVLTVMVRLLLFYPSRKQTQMNLRMVELQKKLAPQIDDLKARYADDPREFHRAKMQLLMRNGMNPFAAMGGCLLLLAQLPIMMGLYYCLQESVFFRLEPFAWVRNMAAPDMTLWWSEKIPWVSTPDDMGSFLYLGPYFNVLPLLAVALMIWQQNKMMPPPTDETMAQQQKMMKYMMVAVAIMFYKVAAGLALYFIIGSAWALIERRLIPKATDAKPGEAGAAAAAGGNLVQTTAGPVAVPQPKGYFGRLREKIRERFEEAQRQADEMAKRQIRNEPNRGPNQPPPHRDDRRDKKKKRRK